MTNDYYKGKQLIAKNPSNSYEACYINLKDNTLAFEGGDWRQGGFYLLSDYHEDYKERLMYELKRLKENNSTYYSKIMEAVKENGIKVDFPVEEITENLHDKIKELKKENSDLQSKFGTFKCRLAMFGYNYLSGQEKQALQDIIDEF